MIRFPNPIYVTRPLLPPLEVLTKRLAEVWASGWITNNGRQHERLETTLREYLGVPHLSLFNNGTIALLTAVRALDLSGEVITTPFTFPATPHVLTWSGITPVFADVDPTRLTLDPARVEEAITPQTTGILAVHVYGWPCDVDGLQRVADHHGLKLLYDGAHVFGTTVNGAGVGIFGDITMFSFHATKLFHTAEGGALACRDAERHAQIDRLKNFGIVDPETVASVGLNGKMNELQAAVGLTVLEYLQDEIAERKALVELYMRLLGNVAGITMLTEPSGVASNYQYCVIRVDEDRFGCSRDSVHVELHKHNVISRKYFFPLCSDYSCYRHLPSADPSRLPVAQLAARQVLCLPLYGALAPNDVEGICEIVATLQGMRRLIISFVIPVFRNERAVTITYEKIVAMCQSDLPGYDREFVFVDDGSDDGSLDELLAIRQRDPMVRIISFTRNFGQMAAILAGLKASKGDLVLHLSADLQDPVELIPRMVQQFEAGAEVVVAHRENREDGLTSRLTSRLFYGIIRLSFPEIPPGGFDYVLMARKVVDAFNSFEVRNRFFQGDVLWLGYRTSFIPYTRAKRVIGKSQYTFAKRLKNSLDAILDSSYLPIRFISLVGVLTALTGFLYAIDIVYARIRHHIPATGLAPIMILVLVIGGLLMLMLGIIGEYVWRIYDEVKGKPNYIVREIYQ